LITNLPASFNAASYHSEPNTYPLRYSAILDSGSTCHIYNDIDRFSALRPPSPGDYIWAGSSRVWIKGYGSVHLHIRSREGTRTIRLDNVAYCPDLLCNLVSFRLLRRQGLWWDTRGDPTTIKRRDNTILAELQEIHDQWVLEYRDRPAIDRTAIHSTYATHKVNTRTARRAQKADAITWHKRLGHPGPQALEHAANHSEGVRLKGIPTVCEGLRKGCRCLVTGLYSMKKLSMPMLSLYIQWCCVREVSNTSENAEEVWWCVVREASRDSENAEGASRDPPRVPPRNTTLTRL